MMRERTVNKHQVLQSVEEATLSRDPERIRATLARRTESEATPEEALEALTRGMERARTLFQDRRLPLPELLLTLDVFREGLGLLKPLLHGKTRPKRGASIVIGVVEGDVHDLGKNIIAAILEMSGYRVRDLGKDVKRDAFLEAVREERARILAISSMMSTPLDNMRELIAWARKLSPAMGVLVGGAALDQTLAVKLGADGYAADAGTVVGEVGRLLGRRPRAADARPG